MTATRSLLAVSFFTLFTATFSGCRFGNYSDVSQPIPDPSAAGSTINKTEMFFTQPTQMETIVFYSDSTIPTGDIPQTPLASIPSDTLAIFTNPLYFATMVDPTAPSIFVGQNKSSYTYTQADASGNISDFEYVTDNPKPLYTNPNCLTQVQFTQDGLLNRSLPGSFTFADGSSSKVAGRLTLNYTSVTVIEAETPGACDADLQYLAACYQVGTGCTNAELTQAKTLFDLYVRQTGLLNLNNVTKVKGLAYIVHFE